jgi:hypothetical protein
MQPILHDCPDVLQETIIRIDRTGACSAGWTDVHPFLDDENPSADDYNHHESIPTSAHKFVVLNKKKRAVGVFIAEET